MNISTGKNISKNKNMRKNNSAEKDKSRGLKIASIIFLVFIGAAFIGAPLVGVFSNNSTGKVIFGSYSGKEIAYTPDNYFGQMIRGQLQNFQGSDSAEVDRFSLQVLWQQAFDNMSYITSLLLLAQKAGLSVHQDTIKEEIRKLPLFEEEGKFSNRLYEEVSNTYRKNLFEIQKTDIITNRILRDLSATTILNKNQKDFFAEMGNQLRSFRYVRFDRNEITDKFARAYFDDNPLFFSRATIRSITAVSEEAAKALRLQIQDGETTFSEQAQASSLDEGKNSEGERILYYYELTNELGDDLAPAVTALSPNQLSEVVVTLDGNFAFYQLMSLEDSLFDDEDTKDEVNRYLRLFEVTLVEEQNTQKAQEFISLATSLGKDGANEASTQLGIELGRTSTFPLNYNNTSLFSEITSTLGPGIATLAQEEDTLSTLFSLSKDAYSQPIAIGSFLYVFQVDEIETNGEEFQETSFYQYKQSATNGQLRESLVDESKLRSRFDRAFNSLYDFSEDL